MHRRPLNRFFKFFIFGILYSITYLLISFFLTLPPTYSLVSDNLRIGNKYVLIYLVAKAPVFSDPEGADVFTIRRCDYCFITNNKGFMPTTEYDAIVIYGNKSLLETDSAAMDPGNRYVMETSDECLRKKLIGCVSEPVLTSFETRESVDLCQICRHLHLERKSADSGFVIRKQLSSHEKCVHPQ